MCGIVGAIADRDILPTLVEGLTRLEYRGYDSAGLAAILDGGTDLLSLMKDDIEQPARLVNIKQVNDRALMPHGITNAKGGVAIGAA